MVNVGDLRCVFSRVGKVIDLLEDYKLENFLERERIVVAGGKVIVEGRVNGGLNFFRVFGKLLFFVLNVFRVFSVGLK